MQSKWNELRARDAIETYAEKGVSEDLALRVYTTRLLGRDPLLVLHGGGNTSVKTRAKDSMRAFDKLTTMVDGEPRIISDPPLIVPIEELVGAQQHEIEEFARGVLRS